MTIEMTETPRQIKVIVATKSTKRNEFFIQNSLLNDKRRRRKQQKKKSCWTPLRCAYFSKFIVMASVVWCSGVEKCETLQVARKEQQRCPNLCSCYDEYKEVRCKNENLGSIPTNIPSRVNILIWSGNNVGSIRTTSFTKLTRLTNLQLQQNRIYEISDTAFFRQKKLEILNLSSNKLTKYPSTALGFLKNLKQLNLRNNPITQIIAFQFGEMGGSLIQLDLGELRRLTYVSSSAFTELRNLKIFNMDSCNLQEIPNISAMRNLEEINFSSNQITRIQFGSFQGLNKLARIKLDSCQIKEIENKAFVDLVSLQYMSLIRNNLTSMKGDLFINNQALQSLNLQYNPWNCDCNIMSLVGYLSDHNICDVGECPTCTSPTSYEGRLLTSLIKSSMLQCASFRIKPAEQTVNITAGRPARIICPSIISARDIQMDRVKWYLPNGQKLNNRSYLTRVTQMDNGRLGFSRVNFKDAGKYTCTVTSADDQTFNSTVILNVKDRVAMLSSTTSTIKMVTTTRKITRSKVNRNGKQSTTTTTTNTPSKSLTSSTTTPTSTATRLTTIRSKPSTINFNKLTKTSTTKARSDLKRIELNSFPPAQDQSLITTNLVIGCFITLTLIAGLILIIFYKIKKKNENFLRRSSSDLSQSNCELSNDHLNQVNGSKQATSRTPSFLHSPENTSGSKNAMAHSITETWVSALPHHMRPPKVHLPPTAVCVLPLPPKEWKTTSKASHNSSEHFNTKTMKRELEQRDLANTSNNGGIRQSLHNKILCDVQQQRKCYSLERNLESNKLYATQKSNGTSHITKETCSCKDNKRPISCSNFSSNTSHLENKSQTVNHVRFKNDKTIIAFTNTQPNETSYLRNKEKKNILARVKSVERINSKETQI